ncbi:MAG: family 16 glycoside hydrolase [Armatimonadota bacterium]
MTRKQQSPGIGGVLAATAAVLVVLSAAAVARTPAFAQDAPTMLEDTAEAPYALAANLHVTDPDGLDLQIFLERQDADNGYVITCTPRETFVERIVDGEATRIGHGRPAGELTADSDLELTVRRDNWRIVFVLGREVLAQAWDSTLAGGGVGYAVTGGEVADALVQPLGRVYMTDDFMRIGEEASQWEPATGTWETQELRVDEQSERMEADKSANAFSYWGKAGEEGPALATTGYWFWNNYLVSAAVRASETDPVGLVAYYQDPENYILARWTSALSEAADADLLQLIGVRNGDRSVLAETRGGHLPGQWYQLELRVCDGVVQCLVDDEPRLVAHFDAFGQGQPALYCEGEGGTFFDSVAIEDWEVLSENFERTPPGKWAARTGDWTAEGGAMVAAGEGARLVVTGRPDWQDYWVAASVEMGGAAGIAVCADESSMYELRLGTQGSDVEYEGQAQLVRVVEGATEVLSSAPARIAPGSTHRLKVVVDDGLLTGYLDGKRVLDAYDADATAGRIGLVADGRGTVRFDDVYLTMIPPKRIARVTKEFAEDDAHPEMAEWASTRAPWLTPDEDDEVWWTKGDYFGDKTIAFEIPGVEAAEGSVRLSLEAAPDEEGSGATLVIATVEDASNVTATLTVGGEEIGEETVEVQSDPCPVRFERKGTWVVASIDGHVVFNTKR